MQKLLGAFLISGRKRRSRMIGAALWLLRLIREAEHGELSRCSDLLDRLDEQGDRACRREYNAVEDEYLNCECALGFLECAIDDLEGAY